MRRHHLIDEVKSELDIAYAEIRTSERAAITDGSTMATDGLQGELRYPARAAMEKLRILGHCYEHVLACDDAGEAGQQICRILTRRDDGDDDGLGPLSIRFGAALYTYSREDSGRENDIAVRDDWRAIEEALRSLGRPV